REDPVELLGARRLVDRDGYRSRRPDGVVDQAPLVPGPAHQTHAVTGLDAGRDQPLGHGHDLVAELGRGDLGQPVRGWPDELHKVRVVDRVLPDGVGQVGRSGHLDHGRHRELTHNANLARSAALRRLTDQNSSIGYEGRSSDEGFYRLRRGFYRPRRRIAGTAGAGGSGILPGWRLQCW